jgi:hypothetical protein
MAVSALVGMLTEDKDKECGGMLKSMNDLLGSSKELATRISDGRPSSITTKMAWDMVRNKWTGNFTIDDWLAGLINTLPLKYRTPAVVTPTYIWDARVLDFIWYSFEK